MCSSTELRGDPWKKRDQKRECGIWLLLTICNSVPSLVKGVEQKYFLCSSLFLGMHYLSMWTYLIFKYLWPFKWKRNVSTEDFLVANVLFDFPWPQVYWFWNEYTKHL